MANINYILSNESIVIDDMKESLYNYNNEIRQGKIKWETSK